MNEIKFKFVISRWANFYYFIQNLSCWHFSNMDIYNTEWRKQLPRFSNEHEHLLNQFAEVRKKHPPADSIFEEAFYSSEEPFIALQKELSSQDLIIIEEIFQSFESFFNIIYKAEKVKLNEWRTDLEKYNYKNNDLQKSIEIFYNKKITKDEVLNCYLLISPLGFSGASIRKNTITLEISNLPLSNIDKVFSVLWHETIHACFDKHYFRELTNSLIITDGQKRALKEIIASSLLPYGFLGEKYFNLKKTNNIYMRYKIDAEKTETIINMSELYIINKKSIDKALLDKILRLINGNGAA